MARFDFYEIAKILPTASAMAMGVANQRGIIVGISEDATGTAYAVSVHGMSYMLTDVDLETTGERVERSAIYGGETIVVEPQRYDDDDDSSR